MINGCRDCTVTALCRSCRRRNPSLPPEDMQTMLTTHEFVSTANAAALAAISDACSSGTDVGGGAFCGDL